MSESTFTHPALVVSVGCDSVSVKAGSGALYTWAHRPGNAWPCSDLAELDSFEATFDEHGLIDLEPMDAELTAAELNAFTSDAIAAVLAESHPCHFVTVGQFVRHGR